MSAAPLVAKLEETARLWGRTIMLSFAAPAPLLERAWLSRAEGKRLRALIAAFEIMVRQFVLALARAMTPPPVRARPKTRTKAPPRPHDPPASDQPSETWTGLAFRLAPTVRTGARRVSDAPPLRRLTHVIATRPLAQRLEAAIRVVLAPERAAQRMARRLAREKTLAPRLVAARPGRAALATSRPLAFFFNDRDRAAELAPLLLDTS